MGVFGMSLFILVLIPVHSPMKSAAEFIITARLIRYTITSGFHNVDLSRGGPLSVLVVSREKPDCWPEPITLGKLGSDLKSSKLE